MTIVLSEDSMNLTQPAIKSGSQTLAELPAAQCPPCHGRCHQGRACTAQGASACSELLEDNEDDRHMAAVAKMQTAFLAVALVAVCTTVAYFMPVLQALVNF